MRFGDVDMVSVPDEIKMRTGFSLETSCNPATPLSPYSYFTCSIQKNNIWGWLKLTGSVILPDY